MKNSIRSVLPLFFVICACATRLAAQDGPVTNPPPQSEKPKGPVAPDINPAALWDGRKMVPFHALDRPKLVKAVEAEFLDDKDYVLGLTEQGESRAYPTRFVWWHHVINDRIERGAGDSSSSFAVTYCSVCNTGIRYDLQLSGRPHFLDFYGLYNGVVALCDRETGSAFLQADGRFVTGPLMGEKLRPGALLDTTWGQWKKLHPDTLVMSPDTVDQKRYSPKEKPEPRGYDKFPAPFFRPSMTRADKRLPFFEKVLGVAVPGNKAGEAMLRRAYPIQKLKDFAGVLNDELGPAAVTVFLEPDSMTATAFSRRLDSRTLQFDLRKQPDGGSGIFDQQTGTRWNIEGQGEAGPLKGRSLDPVENHLSQWYGWVAYFPDTSIYGQSDPPQPVDLTVPGSTW